MEIVASLNFRASVEGGQVTMSVSETCWSSGHGPLIDKFGIPWMVNTIPAADWKPQQG